MSFLVNSYRFGGGGPWTPANIPTALWLDASVTDSVVVTDGKVSAWQDLSGNNRHCVQDNHDRRPTYTGGNTITFFDDQLDSPQNIKCIALSVFACFSAQELEGGGRAVLTVTRNLNFDNGTFHLTYRADIPGKLRSFYTRNGGNITIEFLLSDYPFNEEFNIVSNRRNSMRHDFRFNGVLQGFNSGGDVAMDNNHLILGNYYGPPGYYLRGGIRKVVVLDYYPDDETVFKIEGWMAHNEGLTDKLPGDHPYKIFAP